jgi:serine/threonine protein kinase
MEISKLSISEACARKIIHSIATALFYLSNYGIVHRDPKLANIMMTEEGDVKIVDFGLAK